MSSNKVTKANSGLTKDKVEVYSLFGDFITKLVIAAVLIISFISVLIIIGIQVYKGSCGQIWWLTLINVTVGVGLRTMFKHYFK